MQSLTLHMPEHKGRYVLAVVVFMLVAALITARLYLNDWVKDHVNTVLANIPGYTGSIDAVDIDLYRGAYRVYELKIFKKTGRMPIPFVDIESVDFSIEWKALLQGRIVSEADLVRPVINFAVNRSGTAEQTGAGVDWTKPIQGLMPIDINIVTFHDGKLTYQDFSTDPRVNIYIHKMSGELRNLRNVVDTEKKLPSTMVVKGSSIGGGALDIRGALNILKPFPDMDLNIKLEKVHLPALSNYSNAYAGVTIREGNLNVYSEVVVNNGRVSGYVKPIATNIALIDVNQTSNPIQLAWEVLVAAVVEVFTNQPRDQFATKIPLEGNLNNVETDTMAALGGIIRNAFFEAVRRGFD